MNQKKINDKVRDIEAEREALLKTMSEYIPANIKSKMDAAIYIASRLDNIKFFISHRGTSNADDE